MDKEKPKLADAYRDAMVGKAYLDEHEHAWMELVKAENRATWARRVTNFVTSIAAFACVFLFAPAGHSTAWYALIYVLVVCAVFFVIGLGVEAVAFRMVGGKALKAWEQILQHSPDADGVRRTFSELVLLASRFGDTMDVLERTRRTVDAVARGFDSVVWTNTVEERRAELAENIATARELLTQANEELEVVWQASPNEHPDKARMNAFNAETRCHHILELATACIPTVVIHARKPVF